MTTSFNDRLREMVRYACVSAAGFAADLATLWLLAIQLGVYYLAAAAVGFVIGGLVVYVLSIRFVFNYRRLSSVSVESTTFVALGLIGLVANTGIIFIGVNHLGIDLLPAKLAASSATLFINYALRRLTLFSPPTAAALEKSR